eukprot:SAG22_NODE_1360_length_4622_cov_2.212912_6_plen_241_part_00
MGCGASSSGAQSEFYRHGFELQWKPSHKAGADTSSAAKSFGAIKTAAQLDHATREAESGIDSMERLWVRRHSGTMQQGASAGAKRARGGGGFCRRGSSGDDSVPPPGEPTSPPAHQAGKARPSSRLPSTCANAAARGELSVLQWLRSSGCQWDAETITAAARSGHLDVLQWVVDNGCPWDAGACAAAAAEGHLLILKWLRSVGCPWDMRVMRAATNAGHKELYDWALANGCSGGREEDYY